MKRRIRTAVDTVTEALLVADGEVEAGANSACERSVERDEEEDFGREHICCGRSNGSMMICTVLQLVI